MLQKNVDILVRNQTLRFSQYFTYEKTKFRKCSTIFSLFYVTIKFADPFQVLYGRFR